MLEIRILAQSADDDDDEAEQFIICSSFSDLDFHSVPLVSLSFISSTMSFKLISLFVLLIFSVHFIVCYNGFNGIAAGKQSNWEIIEEKLAKSVNEKKICFFLMLINPAVAKKSDHYLYYVKQGFEYAAQIFKTVTQQIKPLDQEYHFEAVSKSNGMMRYLQKNMNAEESKTFKSWLRQYPVIIMKLANDSSGIQMKLMDNHDSLNYHLILNWLERETRISLVKFSKTMTNSMGNIAVSLLNTLLVVTVLVLLTAGVRNGNFRMKQMATVPMFLFISGHVYNHIHGNPPGDRTWLGVSFSLHYNGQALGESYFVFVIYVALALAFYELIESTKAVNHIEKARLLYQSTGRRVNLKKKTNESSATKRQMIFFTLTISALGFFYHCTMLKY